MPIEDFDLVKIIKCPCGSKNVVSSPCKGIALAFAEHEGYIKLVFTNLSIPCNRQDNNYFTKYHGPTTSTIFDKAKWKTYLDALSFYCRCQCTKFQECHIELIAKDIRKE